MNETELEKELKHLERLHRKLCLAILEAFDGREVDLKIVNPDRLVDAIRMAEAWF